MEVRKSNFVIKLFGTSQVRESLCTTMFNLGYRNAGMSSGFLPGFYQRGMYPKLIFSKSIIMQNLLMFPFLQSFTVSCSFPSPLTAAKFAIETMNESTLNLFWRRWVTTFIVRNIHY